MTKPGAQSGARASARGVLTSAFAAVALFAAGSGRRQQSVEPGQGRRSARGLEPRAVRLRRRRAPRGARGAGAARQAAGLPERQPGEHHARAHGLPRAAGRHHGPARGPEHGRGLRQRAVAARHAQADQLPDHRADVLRSAAAAVRLHDDPGRGRTPAARRQRDAARLPGHGPDRHDDARLQPELLDRKLRDVPLPHDRRYVRTDAGEPVASCGHVAGHAARRSHGRLRRPPRDRHDQPLPVQHRDARAGR
jgi:hypothetical protein